MRLDWFYEWVGLSMWLGKKYVLAYWLNSEENWKSVRKKKARERSEKRRWKVYVKLAKVNSTFRFSRLSDPSSFLPFSNASPSLPLSHCMVCKPVCFYVASSLFPPACVNVRASCCSSQTTPWETDQPHRRGNPLFWLNERGYREERNFYSPEHPQVSSSSLVRVHCSSGLNHVVQLPGFTVCLEEGSVLTGEQLPTIEQMNTNKKNKMDCALFI